MDYKFKFSIITAVYNVETYLESAIESIVNQDIGFLKNVQIILVDDGSTDSSPAICDEYAAKYPNNVFVVHKPNGGVSSARNEGMKHIQGKYTNFLDGDDKLTLKTLKNVWKFFEKYDNETDVVAIPLRFFGGYKGRHPLNYKFEETRLVNLEEEWEYIQLSSSSAFIRSTALEGMFFDKRLAYAEDAKLMQQVLLKKKMLGVVNDAAYMYRRRVLGEGEQSAIQRSTSDPRWYLPYMKYFQLETIEYAKNNFGYIPKFIQCTLLYDLQWRIKEEDLPKDILNEKEIEEYREAINSVLSIVDDDVVMAQRKLFRDYKFFILKKKYGSIPATEVIDNDFVYVFSDDAQFKLSECRVKIEFLTVKDNVLSIEGFVRLYSLPYSSTNVFVICNGKKIPCEAVKREEKVTALGSDIIFSCGYKVDIPLENGNVNNLTFGATINGTDVIFTRLCYGYFSPISDTYKFSYCCRENWLISRNANSLTIVNNSLVKKLVSEGKFLAEIVLKKKAPKTALLRFWHYINKHFKIKPLWLISDRPTRPGDNGEAFFRYMRKEHPEINSKFVLTKASPEYKKIKAIGPVVEPRSTKHKLLVLKSDYIVSSQGENEHFDPFGRARNSFRDLTMGRPFVFLQHGVIKDDLSGWLNRYDKNLYGFVTSAKAEYDSILECDYAYTEKEVWLTGLPRFDRLYNNEQKIITIMPTWRKYLTNGRDAATDMWRLKPDFEQSTFFVFYNALLSNEKLMSKLKECGYKIKYLVHPNLRESVNSIKVADENLVELITEDVSYTDIYAVSDLVVTDYSSAVFDFAYLRKPIVYTHFDYNEFVAGEHSYVAGYFEYERDGFGEVEYDLDSTVDRIIEYMENGCELKPKYRERIDNFFAFNDKNNCQRVYEKIIESSRK